jgi:CRISPR-associated endoribonuclease Cas6
MLLSWILSLQPEEPATVSTNLGRAAHAWFLDQVRAADPALAEALHGGQEPALSSAKGQRPFTVSNLWELAREPRPEATLSPLRRYTLRVTSFSPELSALVRERVIPAVLEAPEGERTRAILAGAAFRIVSGTLDPAEHPWAATDTFEGLVQRHTLAPQVARTVGLRFASPTAFRVTGKKWAVPLPLPGLVFGGLLDKWNAFSPVQVHPDVRSFADECLAVSSYRLETRRASFGEEGERGSYSGFVGQCRYYIEVADRYWVGLIQLLAGFSLYAGVGLRTTMGLGQARGLS